MYIYIYTNTHTHLYGCVESATPALKHRQLRECEHRLGELQTSFQRWVKLLWLPSGYD